PLRGRRSWLHRYTTFPVADNRRLLGILSLEDLKQVPRDEWRVRRIRSVMRIVSPQLFVSATTLMSEANDLMERNGLGAVAILNSSGELVGFLRQGRIKRKK